MERRSVLLGAAAVLGGCLFDSSSPGGDGRTLEPTAVTRSGGVYRASPPSPNCERDGEERWGAASRHEFRVETELRSRAAAHRWAREHRDESNVTVVAGVDAVAWLGTRRSISEAYETDEWYVVRYGDGGLDPSRLDVSVLLVPRDGYTDAVEYRWGGIC